MDGYGAFALILVGKSDLSWPAIGRFMGFPPEVDQVSGVGFRASGVGFRASGFGFRVSGVGCQGTKVLNPLMKHFVYLSQRRKARKGKDLKC